jgi:adenylate kinase family enzyme
MSSKPTCIIVTGRPGSGKSTLSKKLGRRLCLPVISRDEIKEGYVNTFGVKHEQLPADTNQGEYVAPDFNVPTIHVLTESHYAPELDEIIGQIQL